MAEEGQLEECMSGFGLGGKGECEWFKWGKGRVKGRTFWDARVRRN